MKAIKIIAVLVLVVIVGIVGLTIFAASQFDNLVKAGIERGGTYVLGVETTVDTVDVGITDGTLAMRGLRIANPEGYTQRDRFMSLGEGDAQLDTGSVGQDVIVIPTLNMTDLQLNLLKEEGKASYEVIMDNLKRFESGEKQPPEGAGEGPKFIINRVVVRNVDVYAALLPVGGDLTAAQVELDEIILTDVGKPSGVKSGEVVNIIMKALLSAVGNKAGQLPGDIGNELIAGLGDLRSLGEMGIGVAADGAEIIGSVGEEAGKAIQDASEAGQKAVDEAKKSVDDAVKGLFGGDEEEGTGGGNN